MYYEVKKKQWNKIEIYVINYYTYCFEHMMLKIDIIIINILLVNKFQIHDFRSYGIVIR